jgi:hypothetical protein
MGNGSNLGTKTVLGASKHQIADHVAGNSLRAGRDVPKCLSVAAIQTEGHFNSFVVPATDLESIGTSTQIAFQSNHLTFMCSGWLAGMSLKQQVILPHNLVDTLMINT